MAGVGVTAGKTIAGEWSGRTGISVAVAVEVSASLELVPFWYLSILPGDSTVVLGAAGGTVFSSVGRRSSGENVDKETPSLVVFAMCSLLVDVVGVARMECGAFLLS